VTELAVGVGGGSALFLVLAGGRVPSRLPRVAPRALALRWLWLAGRAAGEELVWRWLVFSALAVALGVVAALIVSSIGFGAWHGPLPERRSAVHVVTGAGFGGAFLLAGLGGAVVAHATYNMLVDWAVQSERRATPEGGPA
jgi:membrane protease YdiL (CAAX protease family)